MKNPAIVGAALLILAISPVLAEKHADAALKHTKMAIEYGKAGHGPVFHQHASEALIHAQKAAEAAKGESKNHMDAAVKSLKSAVEHGKMPGPEHLEAGNL